MGKNNPKNRCAHLYRGHHAVAAEIDGNDLLRDIFRRQLDFQLKYAREWAGLTGRPDITRGNEEMAHALTIIKENWVNLCAEFGELIDRLPYKSWKVYKSKSTRAEVLEMQFEAVDMLHFLINIMMGLGMSAERTYNMYVSKNDENVKRQKEGY